MNNAQKVVFDNNHILQEICGTVDGNLKYLETLFDSRIFVRGNELIIESQDIGFQARFARLIAELHRFADERITITESLINSCFQAISTNNQSLDLLRENMVSIPQGFKKVYPRNINQASFLAGIRSHDLSFGVGPAGTGKTFLAIAHALSEILSHKKKKLLLTRPVVEAGENLGFLPGDLNQKLNPYIKPLYDAMESMISGDLIAKLEENNVIEIAPLAYMRGRSLVNSYIILDEAQNTTLEQMKMFLTRIGEGSKVVVTGDITQIDLGRGKVSGLVDALRVLEGVKGVYVSQFNTSDVVRSNLVQRIIGAYETDAKKEYQ